MMSWVLLGAGAGLVSALLFASVSTGTLPAVLLMYLAPLPILIVGLGWHHLLALLALACGGIVATFAIRPTAGVAFALGPALSSWALTWLVTTLRQPAGPPPLPGAGRSPSPSGILLLAVGVFGALIAFSALAAATDFDYDRYVRSLTQTASAVLRPEPGDTFRRPPGAPSYGSAELVRIVVALAPALLAALLTLVLGANLWLAGKVVAISGRLRVAWPAVPDARMPPLAIGMLLAGCVMLGMPGFGRVAGLAAVGGLTMAFALQGLALLHFLSRHRPGRGLVLSVAYLLTLLLGYALLPLFAVLGFVDTASSRLRRLGRPPSP